MKQRITSARPDSLRRQITNAFSVDVEDYFQVQAFADRIDRRTWNTYPSRVVENTHRTLSLLAEFGVRGTFFILGWTAERFPKLVCDIQKAGHEIGCHSYWHRLIYEMTPEEFRDDLRQATQTISNITGEPVTLYRAPSFSITESSLWAFDILIDEGYHCDSSIFPVRHDTYGIPGAKRFPHLIQRENGQIQEFPLAVARLRGLNVPIAGGGYFRLIPTKLSLRWLRQFNQHEGQPFVFYIHPWELDPNQPRLPATLRSRFRHYQNLGRTETKLRWLLKRFQFSTMSTALAELHPSKIVDAVDGIQFSSGKQTSPPIPR